MELLTTRDNREIWLHQLVRPFVFKPPLSDRRYVAIVFSNDENVNDSERRALARALFSSGCRCGVFTGHACAKWEWALDLACMESKPDYWPSDEAFTTTTSLERDSVEDVISFGLVYTSSHLDDFDRVLILFAGRRAGLREEVEEAIRSVRPKNLAGPMSVRSGLPSTGLETGKTSWSCNSRREGQITVRSLPQPSQVRCLPASCPQR